MEPDADFCDECTDERGEVAVLEQATRRARFLRRLEYRLGELHRGETA